MPENTPPDYVGLDIAAEHLDYCVNETDEGNCPNDTVGRAELLASGIEACVVQPVRVWAFA